MGSGSCHNIHVKASSDGSEAAILAIYPCSHLPRIQNMKTIPSPVRLARSFFLGFNFGTSAKNSSLAFAYPNLIHPLGSSQKLLLSITYPQIALAEYNIHLLWPSMLLLLLLSSSFQSCAYYSLHYLQIEISSPLQSVKSL